MNFKFTNCALLIVLGLATTLAQTSEVHQGTYRPKITYKHATSRHKTLKAVVHKTIVDPIICDSDKPIEEIVVDFCPKILGLIEGERGCDHEAQGKLTISITVNRFDGASAVIWIDRNPDGSFDRDTYLKIFDAERAGRPPKTGCAPRDD